MPFISSSKLKVDRSTQPTRTSPSAVPNSQLLQLGWLARLCRLANKQKMHPNVTVHYFQQGEHSDAGSLSAQFSKTMRQGLDAALQTHNTCAWGEKHPEMRRALLYVSVTSKHAHPLF